MCAWPRVHYNAAIVSDSAAVTKKTPEQSGPPTSFVPEDADQTVCCELTIRLVEAKASQNVARAVIPKSSVCGTAHSQVKQGLHQKSLSKLQRLFWNMAPGKSW